MKVTGKGGISAEIIADSVSSVNGKRLTTFELEYPRFLHSEFMTHRLFSRNAASSRAIPIERMIKQVEDSPAIPIHWGRNQKGMQAKEELNFEHKEMAQLRWACSSEQAVQEADNLNGLGAHKQIVNRILEPYQFIKVVCSGTEFDNFFWLRCHEDAQPEIKELADCMYKAYSQNVPQELQPGEWHTPYVEHFRYKGKLTYQGIMDDGYIDNISLEQALKVSASCCAQVSFRTLDNSLEKACKIYQKLVESKPVHSSPTEHQGTPIGYDEECKFDKTWWSGWEKGITHQDKEGNFWSGNFQGFIQHRQLIPENTCWEYSSTSA